MNDANPPSPPWHNWKGPAMRALFRSVQEVPDGTRTALHHPGHVRHATAGTGAGLLRSLGDDRLGREDVLRDRRGVLERRARHHRRIDDAALDEILDLARVDVQALARLRRAHGVDHVRALETCVRRELTERLLERAQDDLRARPLVALELLADLPDSVGRVQQRNAAAGDDAFLERRAGRLKGVLDAVLLLLHLGLGGSADLDHGDTAAELRQPLLQLLAVEV